MDFIIISFIISFNFYNLCFNLDKPGRLNKNYPIKDYYGSRFKG